LLSRVYLDKTERRGREVNPGSRDPLGYLAKMASTDSVDQKETADSRAHRAGMESWAA
jgi:hypothetical protein